MPNPSWVRWFVNTNKNIQTVDGKIVEVLEFCHTADATILSEWACHIRNHYCGDSEIDILRQGTGHSRGEYLKEKKFPTREGAPGPSTRAGDIGEILVADYTQYIMGYHVPRTRYDRRTVRNDPTKGSDVIGFKLVNDVEHLDANDSLLVLESKAQFSDGPPENKLQDAVKGSAKDAVRLGESLNAMKQRLLDRHEIEEAKVVERFQDPEDKPYDERFGAAALYSTSVYDADVVSTTDTRGHPNNSRLELFVIYGSEMMDLIHGIYDRAANEA